MRDIPRVAWLFVLLCALARPSFSLTELNSQAGRSSGSSPVAALPASAVNATLGSGAPAASSLRLSGSLLAPAEAPKVTAPSLPAEQRKFGVELEYALSPAPQDAGKITAQAYAGVLAVVRNHLGLSEPQTSADSKHGTGYSAAEAVDFDGRGWKAIPEEVEGRNYDGVELITPPLSGTAEEAALVAAHQELLASGEYRRGFSSSAHFTFDVSDLITESSDASRLVDAILFIESNWPRLYAAAAPVRYGSLVNRFATPLALDQVELLQELAALPRPQRSFANVRAIFAKYAARELALQGGHPGKSWKMRAANYGKLFGLQFGYADQPLPVIEVRVSDLPEGADLAKLRALFSSALSRAPPQDRFVPPFKAPRPFVEVSARIANQDRSGYEGFLRGLRLDPADYPFLGRLTGLPASASVEQVAFAALTAAAKAALPFGLARHSQAATSLELIDSLLATGSAVERRFAVAALNGRTDAEAIPRAQALASDPDEDVRGAAVDLLTQRDGGSVWSVLSRAVIDEAASIRRTAIMALVPRDEPRAALLLRQAISDPDEGNRNWAWHALGAHTTTQTADILASLLVGQSPEVTATAWNLLLQRRDKRARKIVAKSQRGGY